LVADRLVAAAVCALFRHACVPLFLPHCRICHGCLNLTACRNVSFVCTLVTCVQHYAGCRAGCLPDWFSFLPILFPFMPGCAMIHNLSTFAFSARHMVPIHFPCLLRMPRFGCPCPDQPQVEPLPDLGPRPPACNTFCSLCPCALSYFPCLQEHTDTCLTTPPCCLRPHLAAMPCLPRYRPPYPWSSCPQPLTPVNLTPLPSCLGLLLAVYNP